MNVIDVYCWNFKY